MLPHRSVVHAVTFLLMAASPALAVKGDWHADAESALADALSAKRPVLAVAMDHG